MGMLLTWCANMQMLSAEVEQTHQSLILRLRFEDALGSELLTACGGTLSRALFNSVGQEFLDTFYPRYMSVYKDTFGDDCYAVAENWTNYQQLAQVLTRAYLGEPGAGKTATRRAGMFAKLSRWLKR